MKLFANQHLGIDLGTAQTVIYIEGKGIALREPSILVRNTQTQETVAYGSKASALVERTSDKYQVIQPIQEGVIADLTATKELLAHYIHQVTSRNVSRSSLIVGIPSQVSKVERQALIDAIREIGVTQARLMVEPFAAALGADLAVDQPRGRMILDLGGGVTDLATISYGEIISQRSLRYSSGLMDQRIQTYLREEYQLQVSAATAKDLKETLGHAQWAPSHLKDQKLVKGYHLGTGQPAEVSVHSVVLARAINEVVEEIIASMREILEETPPDLAVDIMEAGITLTGGGALLSGLPERLQEEMDMPVHLVTTPLDTVALGMGRAFELGIFEQDRPYIQSVR